MDLREGWSHVISGGRVVRASAPLPSPNPPQPVTKAAKVPQVTATVKEAKPKITAAPKKAAVKLKKAASTGAKPVTTPKTVANSPSTSPLKISDLESLPLQACVQLTRRLLATISFLHQGAARTRVVLKTVMFFVAEYGSTP